MWLKILDPTLPAGALLENKIGVALRTLATYKEQRAFRRRPAIHAAQVIGQPSAT